MPHIVAKPRAASILTAWAEQKAVREITVFLHSHGVGTARVVRNLQDLWLQTVSDLGNKHDRSIRAFAVKPRAFGASLSGFGGLCKLLPVPRCPPDNMPCVRSKRGPVH
jgi:hypothetical protein